MAEGEEQFELNLTITSPELIKKLKSLSVRKRTSEVLKVLEDNFLNASPEKTTNKAELQYDKLEFENLVKRVRVLESILKTMADKVTRLEVNAANSLTAGNTNNGSVEEAHEDSEADPLHNDVVNTVNPENLFNKLSGNFL